MTKYIIEITEPAIKDILEIVDYIRNITQSKDVAEEYMSGFFETIKSLEEMPKRFRIVNDPKLSKMDIRYTFFKNYTIVYSVLDSDVKVEVYRVLYSSSDLKTRIMGDYHDR